MTFSGTMEEMFLITQTEWKPELDWNSIIYCRFFITLVGLITLTLFLFWESNPSLLCLLGRHVLMISPWWWEI